MNQTLVSVAHSYVWHIRLVDVVAPRAVLLPILAEPDGLSLLGKATHHHTVPGQLTHVTRAQLPHLGRYAVLLHQGLSREVELQRVISGQGHDEASGVELRQRVLVVVQEEGIVAERRHCNANLREIVQILQHWTLQQTEFVTISKHQLSSGHVEQKLSILKVEKTKLCDCKSCHM